MGSSSFARHYSRNRYLLSLPRPTKMFQFSRFPSTLPIYSEAGNVALPTLGFPIRTFPDQSLMTALRDLSQSSTSFIGDIRQGIHFVPLSTFLCIDSTSNWKLPITCRQSLKNFLTSLIVKFHELPYVSARTHSNPSFLVVESICSRRSLAGNFTILSFR